MTCPAPTNVQIFADASSQLVLVSWDYDFPAPSRFDVEVDFLFRGVTFEPILHRSAAARQRGLRWESRFIKSGETVRGSVRAMCKSCEESSASISPELVI